MGALGTKMSRTSDTPKKVDDNPESNRTPQKYCLTPPMKKRQLIIDPRSATLGISRTPIYVAPNSTENVTPKTSETRPYLETNMDETGKIFHGNLLDPRSPNAPLPRTPISMTNSEDIEEFSTPTGPEMNFHKKILLKNFDPRSPACEFNRTPILKTTPLETRRLSLVEDSSDDKNSWDEILYTKTPPLSRHSFCEIITSFEVPEVQVLLPDIATDSVECVENEEFDEKLEENQDSENTTNDKKIMIDNILSNAMKNVEIGKNKNNLGKIAIWNDKENNGENKKIGVEENSQKFETEKKKVDVKNRRTPLANRSNNHELPHGTSPATVFRLKRNTGKSGENTPTSIKRFGPTTKMSETVWDPESSVVI